MAAGALRDVGASPAPGGVRALRARVGAARENSALLAEPRKLDAGCSAGGVASVSAGVGGTAMHGDAPHAEWGGGAAQAGVACNKAAGCAPSLGFPISTPATVFTL